MKMTDVSRELGAKWKALSEGRFLPPAFENGWMGGDEGKLVVLLPLYPSSADFLPLNLVFLKRERKTGSSVYWSMLIF